MTTESNNFDDSRRDVKQVRNKFNGNNIGGVKSKINSQIERDYYKNKINQHAKRSQVRIKHENPCRDSNFNNLKNQNMFIPNQSNVSQVKGKSRQYL